MVGVGWLVEKEVKGLIYTLIYIYIYAHRQHYGDSQRKKGMGQVEEGKGG